MRFGRRYGEILKKYGFPKQMRLRSTGQFRAVLGERNCVSDPLLRIFAAKNGYGHSRLGVSVGKRCGIAVVRNRLKRLIREAFRQSVESIPHGFDYVVIVSPSQSRSKTSRLYLKNVSFEEMRDSLEKLTNKVVKKIE